MSILPFGAGAIGLAVSQADTSTVELAMVIGCIGIALSLASAAEVFDFRRIDGPERLGSEHRVGTLWFVFFMGFGAWVMAQSVYASLSLPAATQPATQATTQAALSQAEVVIAGTLGQLALLAALIAANIALRPGGLRQLGFGFRCLIRSFKPGAVAVAIVLPLMYAVMLATQKLWEAVGYNHPTAHPLLEFVKKQPESPLASLVAISALFLAPIAEEMLFRGHLQTGVAYGMNLLLGRQPSDPLSATARMLAIVLTSLAFASVHPIWMAPPILVLAVVLGYAYERTGNLWVPILIHMSFNGFNLFNFWSQLSNH